MKLTHKLLGILIIVIVGVAVYGMAGKANKLGSAVPGLYALNATSSSVTVGTQLNATLFTNNLVCDSRVISTRANNIMLSFNDNIAPSATVGHLQLASTTVVYDSGQYGCGNVTAYGYTSSSTITVSEFR